jgi:hypothetical protein
MILGDSIVVKGAGNQTRLIFDLGGIASFDHMIDVKGTKSGVPYVVLQSVPKNTTTLSLSTTAGLQAGDWVMIYGNDIALTTSAWAYGTVGQLFRIASVNGNTITSDQPMRREYDLSFVPRIKKIEPVKGVGIECLYMQRVDSTVAQTYNINFTDAVHSWVIGVESNKTNFAHIGITTSSHILVRGNYLHHSHGYGGGGQGYGVALQYTSGDCLIENNIFEHLRHSMLLQAGANGNVLAYNYSTDPYWIEPQLPANSAGDAVLHGNYPYLNLFEGNILQNIVVDNSHGINGPYNTFFRNRAQTYGIFQNNNPATDSMNYIGNEVTGTGPLMGNYALTGVGHYERGNIIKSVVTPAGTSPVVENSLYLSDTPRYWYAMAWPNIGNTATYNQGSIPAAIRFSKGDFTDCRLSPVIDHTVGVADVANDLELNVYPTPASQYVVFDYNIPSLSGSAHISIMDMTGRLIKSIPLDGRKGSVRWNVDVPYGIYLYRLQDERSTLRTGKLVIVE